MNGKKTKILCAVIAVLVVIIGILVGVLIAQNNKKTAEPGDDYAVSVEMVLVCDLLGHLPCVLLFLSAHNSVGLHEDCFHPHQE